MKTSNYNNPFYVTDSNISKQIFIDHITNKEYLKPRIFYTPYDPLSKTIMSLNHKYNVVNIGEFNEDDLNHLKTYLDFNGINSWILMLGGELEDFISRDLLYLVPYLEIVEIKKSHKNILSLLPYDKLHNMLPYHSYHLDNKNFELLLIEILMSIYPNDKLLIDKIKLILNNQKDYFDGDLKLKKNVKRYLKGKKLK